MRITINGDLREVPEPSTIESLVHFLELPAATLLIELNEVALRKSEWSGSDLKPGDRVEFIRIAAGG